MVENDHISKAYPSFISKLEYVVKHASSPGDIESWLNAQKFIVSVALQPYHIKTEPPQLEFLVEFRMPDGSKNTKVIDILLSSPLSVCDIHDA